MTTGSEAAQQQRARRNTIGDALRRSARRFRDRPALRFGERQWSYAALDLAADRVARCLLAQGLKPGDRVLAYGRNSDGYLLAWLGCARAGLIHVPANFALTAGELEHIARQSGAAALLTQPALRATAEAVRGRLGIAVAGTLEEGAAGPGGFDVLAAAQDPRWGGPGDPPPGEAVRDEDVAQLLYTSGTTGLPKGAMMTHRALLAEYMSCIVELEFAGEDRVLASLPLYHSAQMHCFTMPQLLVGASIVLIEAPEPARVLELIERHRISSFFAPPTVWIGLLRHPDFARRDLGALRKIYYGASIMPVPVLQELRERLPGVRPFNCYGQSEIAPLATVLRPEEHDARPGSVGRPILNVETRVVDAAMRDVAPGERGEIVHRSPQLLVGYWDNPEETARAFEGGWFHSGDVAEVDAEGYLYIVDRTKDLINTGGVLVASREVEEALFTHPAVAEVAVIAVPDPRWIEAVTAVVVLRADAAGGGAAPEEIERALIAHARERLAPYKVPKRVILTDALPKNTAGKLLKRELRARYAGTGDAALGHGLAAPAPGGG
ncbi:acyl-CoA synthetase [Caldovatus sediminis]|uniref:Acyl-CoA synthetase n=1 Tax=Caldovatus sediminis TaxID=2041189 RepID=A0A8J2Z7J1_9PROT|nr:fatty acyl-CoA synthetase [Caldovatus sediminis]GGG18126.1 acyl-CoA synthetase [Caldovatus sediminis]